MAQPNQKMPVQTPQQPARNPDEVLPPANPQQQQQQQQPPGEMQRTISTGLTNMGFAFLGSAFAQEFNNPALAKPFEQMGANITNTLHDRWWKAEYDNFISQNGRPYQDKMMAIRTKMSDTMSMINRGVYTDANGVTQNLDLDSPAGKERVSLLRQEAFTSSLSGISNLTDQYAQSAGKYANNPYINKEIEGVVTRQSESISQQFGPTMVQANEASRAQTRLMDSQAHKEDRLPADRSKGSETDKLKNATIGDLIQNKGIDWTADYLPNTPQGREKIAAFIGGARAEVTQQIIETQKKPDGTPYSETNDAEELGRMVDTLNPRVMRIATGRALKQVRPDLATPWSENNPTFFPHKDIEKDSRPLNRKNTEIRQKDYVANAIQVMDDIVYNENPTSFDGTVDAVMAEINRQLTEEFGLSTSTDITKKKIRTEVINTINNMSKLKTLNPNIYNHFSKSGKVSTGRRGSPMRGRSARQRERYKKAGILVDGS